MQKSVKILGTLLVTILAAIGGYYGIKVYKTHILEQERKIVETKNKECYESVQKIKLDEKSSSIYGQFYSKKVGTCLYYGAFWGNSLEGKFSWGNYRLMELYSGKKLELVSICSDISNCSLITSDDSPIISSKRDEFYKIVEGYR